MNRSGRRAAPRIVPLTRERRRDRLQHYTRLVAAQLRRLRRHH